MNNCQLIGHLVRDPELRTVASTGKSVANFTLAVNRTYKKEEVDFLRIVVWGNQAESVSKYLKKGSQCAIQGSIQTGSYKDKDGKTIYTTDINAQRVEFLGGGKPAQTERQEQATPDPDDFPVIGDEDVPF